MRGRVNGRASLVTPFGFVGIFIVVAIGLTTLPIVLNYFIAPKKPNKIKGETYECGIETVGDTWVQFKSQYYIYALIFVIFDIEAVFLFPWALAYNELELFAVIEMIIFILILAAGLIYAWRKGALEWN